MTPFHVMTSFHLKPEGPLVLQPEEVVIIGNRSLEQLTNGMYKVRGSF
jgi:hypothetical protein